MTLFERRVAYTLGMERLQRIWSYLLKRKMRLYREGAMSDGGPRVFHFNLKDGTRVLEHITVTAGSHTEAVKLAKDCILPDTPHEAVLEFDDTSKDERDLC